MRDATTVLAQVARGSRAAAEELLPAVYSELRELAGRYLGGQRQHTLQPTALVHEAYLKLVDQTRAGWNDRTHFFAVAATAMRQILVDHARAKGAEKRGGGRRRLTLSRVEADHRGAAVDLLALDTAMRTLAEHSERKARVVELRFFAGLTIEETARVLSVATTTVEGDWRFARAWLHDRLGRGEDE